MSRPRPAENPNHACHQAGRTFLRVLAELRRAAAALRRESRRACPDPTDARHVRQHIDSLLWQMDAVRGAVEMALHPAILSAARRTSADASVA